MKKNFPEYTVRRRKMQVRSLNNPLTDSLPGGSDEKTFRKEICQFFQE